MYIKRKNEAKTNNSTKGRANLTQADDHAKIAKAAYFEAENRGFAGGRELEDWLTAERAITKKGILLK